MFNKFMKSVYIVGCFVFVWMLFHYSLVMWETRQRYGILFLGLTLLLGAVQKTILKDNEKVTTSRLIFSIINILTVFTAMLGTYYFWTEYEALSWERAGAINSTDFYIGLAMIVGSVYITWATSGPIIPIVAIIFSSYSLFGHFIPGFLNHPPISLTRFVSINAADIDGIYGSLTQLGATWIAIFAFLAGMIEGFGGLDYILRLCNQVFSRKKTTIPQIAVVSSLVFGGMSGSAAANAAGTGAFTIPLMKRFGIPRATAGAIETIASAGGQVMPPILGSAAFVMCDYLNVYYKDILLASIFSALLFFMSVMLSVHYLSKRYIDPTADIDVPDELKMRMSRIEMFRGLPIALSMGGLLFVFIVFKINILLGGLIAIALYLTFQLVYEIVYTKGNISFVKNYLLGIYRGTIAGAKMMITLGAMLATLGIVVRVLITTGLAEKISYSMVNLFGNNLALFLFVTMLVCILFGMAVSTVAAYIMVVTLAAPALVNLGLEPIVSHFVVFYWAMLSAFTPPVAGVAVIACGIAKANFFKTCWESMKLGFPLFVLPFFFVRYPDILSFTGSGFVAFTFAAIGFFAVASALQSGWGRLPQSALMFLGAVTLIDLGMFMNITCSSLTVIALIFCWKKYSSKVLLKPASGKQEIGMSVSEAN